MKRMKFLMPFLFLGIAAGFSAIVMLLWNWLMPEIFGLITINFWQAVGLLLLSKILFGRFHGKHRMMGRHHGMRGNAIREKWMEMTPEERNEFIKKRHQHMRGGHFGHHDFFWGCDDKAKAHNTPKENE